MVIWHWMLFHGATCRRRLPYEVIPIDTLSSTVRDIGWQCTMVDPNTSSQRQYDYIKADLVPTSAPQLA